MHAAHLIISGTVQGVGYRAWFADTAQKLGLRGWVKNLPDGTVEAIVAGAPDELQDLIDRAHSGPRRAQVADIASADTKAQQLAKLPVGMEVR